MTCTMRAALQWLAAAVLALGLCAPATAARTVAELSALAREATFEVVLPKIEPTHVEYEKPLPLELLPFTERNDRFWSIGTAFAIAPDVFVSNAHVLMSGLGSPMGQPYLRDAAGTTYQIERVLKFSLHEDYVLFRARGARAGQVLQPAAEAEPAIGTKVYAVGNALGEGVVLRDGLLTSLTPEDQDGRWKWLRFSAATSPGNSGGPLLDEEGRVLGVVTARSPGENLNYALPIGRVLAGSEREGTMDLRTSFGVPILRQQMVAELKSTLPLPLDWEEFSRRMLELDQQQYLQNQQRLLQQHAAQLPPGGQSARLLATLDRSIRFGLIGQRPDDSWGILTMEGAQVTELVDGETLEMGSFNGAIGFTWQHAADAGGEPRPRDGKAFMDGLLKSLQLPRIIGSQAIRITSLGAPAEELLHADRFGRTWQLRMWSLGYSDMQIVTLSLPTPDGNAGLLHFSTAATRASVVAGLKLMADYVHLRYQGSVPQWRRFVADQQFCPPSLRALEFAPDSGAKLTLAGLDVHVPDSLLALTEDSELVVLTGYRADAGSLVAELAGITLSQTADEDDGSWVGIWAQRRPAEGAGADLLKRWRELSAREAGFDGKPENDRDSGTAWATSAIGDPDTGLQYEVTLTLRERSLLPRDVIQRRDALHAGLLFREE